MKFGCCAPIRLYDEVVKAGYDYIDVNGADLYELSEEEFEVDLGYCPLVNAWQKLEQDEKFLADICDICMEMDRGIAESLGMSMDLKATIASGCGKCTMCFKK